MDEVLLNSCQDEEIAVFVDTALYCTSHVPSHRPNMIQVVKMLENHQNPRASVSTEYSNGSSSYTLWWFVASLDRGGGSYALNKPILQYWTMTMGVASPAREVYAICRGYPSPISRVTNRVQSMPKSEASLILVIFLSHAYFSWRGWTVGFPTSFLNNWSILACSQSTTFNPYHSSQLHLCIWNY